MRINLKEAARLLSQENVVAVPTETVYGLAGCLTSKSAIEAIYQIKKRPSNNPLIIHVGHCQEVMKYLEKKVPDFERLAQTFWPGPMTLILPVNTSLVPDLARAGLPTAAFRVPKHSLVLELIKQCGPLVAPSANLSGKPSPTHPKHVECDLGEDFPVLDGGIVEQGLESTILAFCEDRWQIARQGALPAEAFQGILGYEPSLITSGPICPGQHYKHYAPNAKLFLKEPPGDLNWVIGFSDRIYNQKVKLLSLGPSHDPLEVARNLYSTLRKLDEEGAKEAWVDMNFPEKGLWLTIRERIVRASI